MSDDKMDTADMTLPPLPEPDDFVSLIYRLSPSTTPLMWPPHGMFKFSRPIGGSMRKQRRRKAHPLRFTKAVRYSLRIKPGGNLHRFNATSGAPKFMST